MKRWIWGLGIVVSAVAWGHAAKVEVVVVDDSTERPLEGLSVIGSFQRQLKPSWRNTGGPNLTESMTDAHGRCRLSGDTDTGKVWCFVRPVPKDYYGWNGTGFHFQERNLLGSWQPDDLVSTIRLDRVIHPIPLFLKEVKPNRRMSLLDCEDEKAGYDLVKGDWLPPLGKGKQADFEVIGLPRKELGEGVNGRGDRGEAFRYEAIMRFVGKDNGLVEMHPRTGAGILIREAPEAGYAPECRCWQEKGLDLQWRRSEDDQRCFCFRIRTRRDETGRIVECLYGKIYRDIAIRINESGEVGGVNFTYYLNLTPMDRNLEWDRKTNLCRRGGAQMSIP